MSITRGNVSKFPTFPRVTRYKQSLLQCLKPVVDGFAGFVTGVLGGGAADG